MMVLLILFFSIPLVSAAPLPADFKLNGTNLKTQKFLELKLNDSQKATVVVFLSAQCPCSKGHEKTLTDLYQKYSSQNFRFIGVHSNVNESSNNASSYFKSSSLPFPILQDNQAKLADAFGALKTPHAFIVLPHGEVVFSGGVDDSKTGFEPQRHYLEAALNAVIAGKNPNPSEVKTLGCVIERP